jgi:hypothetical protein
MARKVVETFVSDLSGEQIEEGDAWLMTLTPSDGRRNKVELDINTAEAEAFLGKGREIKRRGRRPGSTNKPKP